MQQRERSSSESYFWPTLLAIALHVLVFGLLLISFAKQPELPPTKPIVQATLYQLQSKSPATSQSSQKIAGEVKKNIARQHETEQLEQRKVEQQRQALAAKAAEQKQAEEARKAAQAQKVAQVQQQAEQRKAAAAAQKIAEAAKAAEAARAAEVSKAAEAKKAKEAAAAKAKAEADAQKKAVEQAELAKKRVAAEEAAKKAAADIAKEKAAEEAVKKKAIQEAAKKKATEEAAKAKAAEEAAKKKAAEEAAKAKATEEAAKKKAAADAAKQAAEDAKKKAAADAAKQATADAARKAQADKKAQALAELLGSDVQRKQAPGDRQGAQTTAGYDDLIRRYVSESWSRPPSARNGMSVTVQINMLPDGTITNASVVKSSGDRAFDNSAVSAVRNVGRITEMQGLTTTDFNPYRSFKMTFTPEDLDL